MGLISAFVGGMSNAFKDQWKEFFYCDEMPENALIVRGKVQNSKNNKGGDNVITNGSKIVVADGQCAIIVEDGRIVEIAAEPGGYTFDTSQSPTVFAGGFFKGLVASFKKGLENFSYGGSQSNYQRVYYFNTRVVLGNLFGTPTPIPYRVVDRNIGLDIDTAVRCNGQFSYQLTDPLSFVQNISGPIKDNFDTTALMSQIKSKFLMALQPAFAELSEQGIRYSALPGHVRELADAINKECASANYGIEIKEVLINSVTIPPEDADMIKKAQMSAINRDPGMAAATLVGAQATAMQDAAKNPNGAMMGFMGMNMAQQAGGMNAQNLFAMQQQQMMQQQAMMQQQQAPAAPAANSWTCSCGTSNTGKFCQNCGAQQPAPAAANGWTCSCGTVNQGKFCANCGAKKPAGAPLYKCDKCGWTPADPTNPPKFCPECGDTFDENDIQ
ncbi:MAG: SPFH domain-containing protein [Oscillospiraceae bacterium]|nr:SPFH domain-containing protein [Oscillospiraceae bacterium]